MKAIAEKINFASTMAEQTELENIPSSMIQQLVDAIADFIDGEDLLG